MKTTLLVLCVLIAMVGCEKRDATAVSQQAGTSLPVSSPALPPVVVPSPEPTPAPDQASASPEIVRTAKPADVLVYKCKTEQGVTFSDAPCGDQQEQLSVRETSVIDNADLREKAEQWKQQDQQEAASRAASLADKAKKESLANRCFDANGNEIACGNTGSGDGQYSPPWYGDPYNNPYYSPYGYGYPNHHHDGRYRDIPPASSDDRYDARDRVIESRFQDPSRAIQQRLGTGGH